MDNRGLPNSFIDMGPSWAQASSAPFRLFKSFTSQGGIKAPMMVKTPGSMDRAGQWNPAFLHVTDILPTVLDLAGATYPETLDGQALKQPTGRSMMPILEGTQATIREEEGVGYELFEMKAYIRDNWKILRLPEPFGSGAWALYDLEVDPGEMQDLSEQHPEIKEELIEAWQRYAEANEVFDHKGRFDVLYRKAYGAN